MSKHRKGAHLVMIATPRSKGHSQRQEVQSHFVGTNFLDKNHRFRWLGLASLVRVDWGLLRGMGQAVVFADRE